MGTFGPDGRYTLTTFSNADGALLGKHRVTIEATRIVGAPAPKNLRDEGIPSTAINQKRVEWLVPEEYARQDSSPLTTEVVRGGNTIDFDLP